MSRAIKKILVPVDFSMGARVALDLAVTMAKAFEASIELFFVWQPPTLMTAPLFVSVTQTEGRPMALEDLARHNASGELQALVELVNKAGLSDVHVRVGIGNPAHEILARAACGYDLIVMGTHGRGGLAHALVGSVAEKVVRRASCPVLTVRSPE